MRKLVLLLVVCYWMAFSESCTCNIKHPQQHFCDSDFVIHVRTRRPRFTPEGLTVYKINIKRIMKATDKARLALRKNLIFTIPGQCEARLKKKSSYVIAGDVEGGRPWVSSCSFTKLLRNLTGKMKKGLRLLYNNGCSCPIVSCHWWDRCPPGKSFCSWATSRDDEDCQERYGVCMKRLNGSCSWVGGRKYRSCMKRRDHQQTLISSNDIITSFRRSHSYHH